MRGREGNGSGAGQHAEAGIACPRRHQPSTTQGCDGACVRVCVTYMRGRWTWETTGAGLYGTTLRLRNAAGLAGCFRCGRRRRPPRLLLPLCSSVLWRPPHCHMDRRGGAVVRGPARRHRHDRIRPAPSIWFPACEPVRRLADWLRLISVSPRQPPRRCLLIPVQSGQWVWRARGGSVRGPPPPLRTRFPCYSSFCAIVSWAGRGACAAGSPEPLGLCLA